MMNLFAFLLAFLFLLFSIFFLGLAYKIYRADPNKYERNRKVNESILDSFLGRANQWLDQDRRNPIVSCGLAVVDGKLRPRGKLSVEAVREITY